MEREACFRAHRHTFKVYGVDTGVLGAVATVLEKSDDVVAANISELTTHTGFDAASEPLILGSPSDGDQGMLLIVLTRVECNLSPQEVVQMCKKSVSELRSRIGKLAREASLRF